MDSTTITSPHVVAAITAILTALAAYLKSVNTAGKNAARIAQLEGDVKRCLEKTDALAAEEKVNPTDYRLFQSNMGTELTAQGKQLSELVGLVQGLD